MTSEPLPLQRLGVSGALFGAVLTFGVQLSLAFTPKPTHI